ncbi:MAG: hypothetical protein ACOYNL_01815 [Rickettsiales bacterium]
MTNIENAYTGEMMTHSDGINYAVLDTTKLDFSNSAYGKKTKATLIKIAKPGEEIIANPGKVEESRVTAKGGEYIFINQLPNGQVDAYMPREADGTPNGKKTIEEKYELVGGDLNAEGAFFRPKGLPSKILYEAITKPTVIKDAWGLGSHQFLGEGSTLKADNGRATGIDKTAFDTTWSLTDEVGRIQTGTLGQTKSR